MNNIHKQLTEYLNRYNEYLHLLEKEKRAIEQEDVKKLEVYIDLEKALAGKIVKQEQLISGLLTADGNNKKEPDIEKLLQSIETARAKALKKNQQNRKLLKEKLDRIKKKMKSIKLILKSQSPFKNIGNPLVIDILR